ncbi:protein-tyrosine phosphatase-like protein, partial [Ochromonadaceae sp. CCMP2298]
MDAITEDVFIGNVAAANDVEALERCGVTHIISLGCEPSNRLQGAEYLAFQCILDTPETLILGILNSTDRFITAARAAHCRVLVHCVHGQSRSATVIISHLLSTGLPLEDCMRLMSERHASTCINPGFLSQL